MDGWMDGDGDGLRWMERAWMGMDGDGDGDGGRDGDGMGIGMGMDADERGRMHACTDGREGYTLDSDEGMNG